MPGAKDRLGPRDSRRSLEASEAWNGFLTGVRNARAELKSPATVWYRGHWHSTYSLLPSLLRVSRGLSKEQELFYKHRQAATYLLKARESDWETVFDMQHYGVPTRLLDWTETLGVAVFFALGTQPSEAAVYVLDPTELNRLTIIEVGRNGDQVGERDQQRRDQHLRQFTPAGGGRFARGFVLLPPRAALPRRQKHRRQPHGRENAGLGQIREAHDHAQRHRPPPYGSPQEPARR